MCLSARKGSRKIAGEDLHVWKLVRFGHDHDHWHGPIYAINGLFDAVVTSTPLDEYEYDQKFNPLYFENTVSITSGFIHAHLTHRNADKLHDALLNEDRAMYERCFICEATIPKGSVYYVGISGKEIATSQIIVHKPKNTE